MFGKKENKDSADAEKRTVGKKTLRSAEEGVAEAEKIIASINPSLHIWDENELENQLLKIGASAVEPLIAALNDKSFKTRSFAIGVLGRLKDKRAVEPLLGAAKDKDDDIRSFSALSLGRLGDTRAVEPLIVLLTKDEESGTRESAAIALGWLGDVRAMDPLSAAVKDTGPGVSSAAKKALETFGQPPKY
jgi:HEAT repeat protein